MRFGDRELSRDRALAFLAGYAVSHADTVRLYDLGVTWMAGRVLVAGPSRLIRSLLPISAAWS